MCRRTWMIPGAMAAAILTGLAGAPELDARQASFPRLLVEEFDVTPPEARVSGTAGTLTVQSAPCRVGVADQELRRRIVDVVTQEWAYFGFPIYDHTVESGPGVSSNGNGTQFSRASAAEILRTATSVAGYWAVTAEGPWIVDRQNVAWNGSGNVTRWRDPWSAAFISWVQCEAGLGERQRFQRAIAHHTYIDQAIRSRDGTVSGAAYAAYDLGETAIVPGDLLCSGRRPAYQNIAQRRRQMGTGAASHCDIVVAVDETHSRILAIGGNVRGTVGMKILPALRTANGTLYPVAQPPGSGTRVLFAHLRLAFDPIDADALSGTPTMQTLTGCSGEASPPAHLFAYGLVELLSFNVRC